MVMTHRTRHRSLRTLAVLLLAVTATWSRSASAQILRVPESDRTSHPVYAAVSIGFLQTQDRYDGQSGTLWRLGEAITYRVAVDYGIRAGAIGVAASMASVPISRGGLAGSDGDIQLRQYLATFRTPETQGFFQVIELSAGLAQWTSYEGTDVLTDEERDARNALAMAIGYGFGFRVGDRMAITLVQDLSMLIGSGEGLQAGERRSVQQYTTRIGARYRF
jgi:hypothetical protein